VTQKFRTYHADSRGSAAWWDKTYDLWILRELPHRKQPTLPFKPFNVKETKGQTLREKTKPVDGAWIRQDSPQWQAWCQHRGRPLPVDRDGGWHVPSEWPPTGKEAAG